ncbi:MAG: hypothetical protein P8N43_01265, partial [Alphaproteobacteria bacterium]|nr:hypothetical protein [Alphaproteobacteria bacterium]
MSATERQIPAALELGAVLVANKTSTRSLPFNTQIRVAIGAANRSTHYAAEWLTLLGNPAQNTTNDAAIIITAGDPARDVADDYAGAGAVIRLWDYQVGHSGTGLHASAASGAASTIGYSG